MDEHADEHRRRESHAKHGEGVAYQQGNKFRTVVDEQLPRDSQNPKHSS
jgi:hypothetical protein